MRGECVPRRRGLRDVRWRALALTLIVVAAGGVVVAALTGSEPPVSPVLGDRARASEAVRREIHQRFQQGVIMLHARQYEHALVAFHRVLELDPALPEAHVNLGFALIGLERYAAARDFFEAAIALRARQANAYYGLAVALDGLRDRPGAIGAMRTFIHLSRPDDPYLSKARAALWEWEAERGPAQVPQQR